MLPYLKQTNEKNTKKTNQNNNEGIKKKKRHWRKHKSGGKYTNYISNS